ncbi:DUF1214 domain-containing protein [[Mycobacterium] nativiensis]|uniref:DUF1214 domain-containing protein n=1 Tax=[Mycobacterium] nativiensis TaxID=2855503 RepID=A0ABU5Y2P0_9MYCO|nr:DUF1214 domain-containing protein [Mycolicibacter sp. MYC340]MEB3033996.1 DUF1214 domain-containing protein [Mycolicibacter sp. MYC340]
MSHPQALSQVARTRRRGFTTRPAMRAAGIATTVVAMTLATPTTAGATSLPVLLTSSDAALQPLIDQILAGQQAMVTADSAMPWATPGNNALLPGLWQNLELQQLLLALHAQSPDQLFAQIPDLTLGNATNARQWALLNNPDVFYRITQGLNPNSSYVISGKFSPGSAELSVNTNSIGPTGSHTVDSLELETGLKINPDGTYTIYVSPNQPDDDSVNWVSSADANYLLARSTMGDWGLGPSTINIECVAECSSATTGVTTTGLSPEAIESALRSVLDGMARTNGTMLALAQQGGITAPDNTMSPFANASTGVIGAAAAQYNSAGSFSLQPDQALIVKVPDVDVAKYGGINLYTAWGQTLPYPLSINSYNNTQAFHSDDGYTYYVVSAQNPGVANWLDTDGLQNGAIYARYLNLPEGTDLTGLAVTTQVVPVADVGQYLPADTPTVSPAEFAAMMNERVLTYDYAMDVARAANTEWVTEQLWVHDLRDAMGASQFAAVFGEDPFTPMWMRLTPALSPDWLAVGKDFLTNPTGSLTAFMNTLPLAGNDINLPVLLTQELLQQNFTETFHAVQAGVTSGNWGQVFADLQTGGQQLFSILNDALFDPNTSITAGILNARDDLATAVMTANGGFPTEAGLLATLEWAVMPQLTQLATATSSADVATDFSALMAALGNAFDSLH